MIQKLWTGGVFVVDSVIGFVFGENVWNSQLRTQNYFFFFFFLHVFNIAHMQSTVAPYQFFVFLEWI